MVKKIFDPIHGFIKIKKWEEELITSLPFKSSKDKARLSAEEPLLTATESLELTKRVKFFSNFKTWPIP